MSDLLNLGLPKWPQMYTTGVPVTIDQAKDIIRRTDRFLVNGSGGNDYAWDRRLAERLRMPHFMDWNRDRSKPIDWARLHLETEAWRARFGSILTEYVHNDWISCSFIGGPHGWCSPSGRIAFSDNVGKWPSVRDVLTDWTLIAEAFPYLDLAATLMSGEGCEDGIQPVVTILVRNGVASVVPGSLDHHASFPAATRFDIDTAVENIGLNARFREHGITDLGWFDEWEQLAAQPWSLP